MREKSHALFIEEKRAWYKKLGKVYCPALKQDVVFNSKGLGIYFLTAQIRQGR